MQRFMVAALGVLLACVAFGQKAPAAPIGLFVVNHAGGGGVDTTPDAFSFTDQTGVSLSSTITSAAITVSGINSAATISVSGGTYDINSSGSFTSSSGTVSNGDTVRARHTSSSSNSTATNTVVTIGGVSDTFSSTTLAAGSTYTCATALSNAASSGVSCPTDPTISSDVTGVTTATFASHTNDSGDNGKRLFITAGSYGNVDVARTDQEWVVASGGNFGVITVSGTRVKVRCEVALACSATRTVMLNTLADITFDGFVFDDHLNSTNGEMTSFGGGTRIAYVNSYIYMYRWCFYIDQTAHFVVGNSRLRTTGNATGCVRLMSGDNTVIADSTTQQDSGTSNAYRVHATDASAGNNWFVRNLVRENGVTLNANSGSGSWMTLGAQYLNSNCFYDSAGTTYIAVGSGTSRATYGQIRDNVGYGWTFWPSSSDFSGGSDIGNNSNPAYQSPPAFNYDGVACS